MLNLSFDEDMPIDLTEPQCSDWEDAYFTRAYVLGSQRVRQMTKTFNDAEAVTRLLLDREKDLELAAKIGKSLLERNHQLQQTNEFLEQQLNRANDQVTQLKYDLQQKISLLQIVTDEEYDRSSSQNEDLSSLADLQKKLKLLEEENLNLKIEANHLKTLTQNLEEREQQLVNDCVLQLSESSDRLSSVSRELDEKNDALSKQQNQISCLLHEIDQLRRSEAKLSSESEDLRCSLYAAKETQMELTKELMDVQDRYVEVINLLAETTEEVKNFENKSEAKFNSSSVSYPGSLASELEASDTFSPRSDSDKVVSVEAVGQPVPRRLETSKQDSAPVQRIETASEPAISAEVATSSGFNGSSTSDTLESSCNDRRLTIHRPLPDFPSSLGLGVPGMPGTGDLDFAIQRLSFISEAERQYRQLFYDRLFRSINAEGMDNTAGAVPPVADLHINWCSGARMYNCDSHYGSSSFIRIIHNWLMPSAHNGWPSRNCVGGDLRSVLSSACSTARAFSKNGIGRSGTPLLHCSAACLISTSGTYSFVNSQIVHPRLQTPDQREGQQTETNKKDKNVSGGWQRSAFWNFRFGDSTRSSWVNSGAPAPTTSSPNPGSSQSSAAQQSWPSVLPDEQ